ncbi:MAG TPA: pseudouridine synthase [Flavobacteriales bacterium]|nr:pseudouridine synthase [Flavobacteriales bacterium]|tara:strand:- start:466 stop:1062 length:597 start_codon:yes stop_codon:yes gene_type:complete
MRTFAINKPYGVLSQFTPEDGHPGLSDLQLGVPRSVWPVGRLDRDSEGLLLLTEDKVLKQRLTNPSRNHNKTYWVQVEGVPSDSCIEPMRHPMQLRIRKKNVVTKPSRVTIIPEPQLPPRTPPIRRRLTISTTWLKIDLTEGKNRQIRKMTAAIGFPALRIVRIGIGSLTLDELGLRPGTCLELESNHIRKLQTISNV